MANRRIIHTNFSAYEGTRTDKDAPIRFNITRSVWLGFDIIDQSSQGIDLTIDECHELIEAVQKALAEVGN